LIPELKKVTTVRNRPFTPRQLLCLGLASLAFGGAVRAANVTHVYGSFGGHWSSGVNALSTVVPNDSNLLLGFSVNGVTYSSGLDDASLTSHNVVFSPQVFRALPVNNPPPAGAALVGIASHWGGINQVTAGGAGEVPAHATRGNSLTPEFRIDAATGKLQTQPGQTVSMSSCLGCWTQCGVRVRVDTESNRILRVAGNPYHPLTTGNPAAMETPVRDVFARLGGDGGLGDRATTCARGSAMAEQQMNPHRVLQPLKRVGPRGGGQWKSISFEDLVKEVCEGGDLFGEGHVDGLRATFDTQTLIDPQNPEYGPKSNQFMFTDATNEGRTALIRRFTEQSFGSTNFGNHGSYCGQSFRVGAGAALGDIRGMPHGKPDWPSAEFGLFIGTAPAQAGNPFQRQGRELAEARSRKDNTFRYVVVSPILPTSSSLAAGNGNRWVAIKPATDLALALGCGTRDRYRDDQLRYDRVVIMTDADVDGAHIATLLMTFFFQEMPGLVAAGRLYLAQPPLYRITAGAESIYARDDVERDYLMGTKFKGRKVEVGRFKGLGEMAPGQLRETTMDPARRTLIRVTLPESHQDRHQVRDLVDRLMGRVPEHRFNFIQAHAATVEVEDIDV